MYIYHFYFMGGGLVRYVIYEFSRKYNTSRCFIYRYNSSQSY
jgi:hypothetical protein